MSERRGTKGLELWCKKMTEGYPGVKIDNMTTSWRDGLAFCAIIHHFRPDLIDFSKLNKDDVYYNNELAFRVAKQYLGIPALLEPEDMVEYAVPDRLSILTYLSQFYQAFAVPQGSRIALKRSTNTSQDNEIVTPATGSPPTKMANIGIGRLRREPCAKCNLPVFIAERLNIGKLLYHRSCFRCARCDSQLTPANYYETENNEFCCELCPDEEKAMTTNTADNNDKDKLLQRSLSDEEKSASLRVFSSQEPDNYSELFETALEDTLPQDVSSDVYTRARSKFFQTQLLDSFADSGNEEELPPSSVPPNLPDSAPPDLPTCVKVDSGYPSVNSINKLSVDVTKDKSVEVTNRHSSLVKERMRIFENKDVSVKSDLRRESQNNKETKVATVPIAILDELDNFDDHLINQKRDDFSKDNISIENMKIDTQKIENNQSVIIGDNNDNNNENVKENVKEVSSSGCDIVAGGKIQKESQETHDDSVIVILDSSEECIDNRNDSGTETFETSNPKTESQTLNRIVEPLESVIIVKKDVNITDDSVILIDNEDSVITIEDSLIESPDKSTSTSHSDKKIEEVEEKQSVSNMDRENGADDSEIVSPHYKTANIDVTDETETPSGSGIRKKISVDWCSITPSHTQVPVQRISINPLETDSDKNISANHNDSIDKIEKQSVPNMDNKKNDADDSEILSPEIGTANSEDTDNIRSDSNVGMKKKISVDWSLITPSHKQVPLQRISMNPFETDVDNEPKSLDNNEFVKPESITPTPRKNLKPLPSPRFKKKQLFTPSPSPSGNPFESDDEGHQDSDKPSLPKTQPRSSYNPFESDDDDETEHQSQPPPQPATRKKKTEPIPKISLNPFGSDVEEDEHENRLPVPTPRLSRTSTGEGLTQSSRLNFGSNSSISSSSVYGSARKKKPAPRPPLLQKPEDSGPNSLTSSPSHSVQQSPRTTPKHRKNRKAPPPPSTMLSSTPAIHSAKSSIDAPNNENPDFNTLQDSSISRISFSPITYDNLERRIQASDIESEKNVKDEANRNKQSSNTYPSLDSESPESTNNSNHANKSTYGRWKRKKGQAPSLPVPQKRTIRCLPMTEIKRELELIEMQQQGLERQGVRLEQIIREKCEGNEDGSIPNPDDVPIEVEDLILQLFELVNEKNELFRKQAELMCLRRQQRLEEEHADIEYQIRCLMLLPEANKTDTDKAKEEELIKRLVDIVERRNEIIECLEMDRLRETQEDDSINTHLNSYSNTTADESKTLESIPEPEKEKEKKKHKKDKKFKLKSKEKTDMDKDIDESEANVKTLEKKKKKFKLNLF